MAPAGKARVVEKKLAKEAGFSYSIDNLILFRKTVVFKPVAHRPFNQRDTIMNSPHTPAKWPFPPVQQPRQARSRSAQGASGKAGTSKKGSLTRGAMLLDVCLVAVWGATIPGLMWLGVASGF